jgi:hypothetical protein
MSVALFTQFCAVCLAILLFVYVRGHRHHPADVFDPMAAWLRAGMYFCFCFLVAACSGALSAALQNPIIAPGQLSDPIWLLSTLFLYGFIIVAYWGYWARNTLKFDRKLDLFPQLLFGLLWGVSSGLFFLAFWHLALLIGHDWGRWQVGLLAYLMISLWQMFWMDMFWDVYVSPEHDTPESIKAKVPRTHIPNMTFCLPYFIVFGNDWIFVSLQTLALMAASIGMRMPAPWSKASTPPARRVPGLLGLPRAGGYVGKY